MTDNRSKYSRVKNLLLRKSILLILYTLVVLYFAVFNWKVFTIMLNINLGFGATQLPPFILLFVLGFILLAIMTWSSYVNNLQRTIYELEQGMELGKMKDKLVQTKVQEHLLEEKNIQMLQEKMGVQDIRKHQDEMMKLMSELKTKLDDKEAGRREAPSIQKDQSQKGS